MTDRENEFKRIVEINGIKIEVDMRTTKRVDQFKVGDRVKLLVKSYGESFTSYPAVIVGFDEFEKLPTIVVAYLTESYSDAGIKFAYINAKTTDNEICGAKDYEFQVSRNVALDYFDREITKKERELADMIAHKEFFERNFDRYFADVEKEKV